MTTTEDPMSAPVPATAHASLTRCPDTYLTPRERTRAVLAGVLTLAAALPATAAASIRTTIEKVTT